MYDMNAWHVHDVAMLALSGGWVVIAGCAVAWTWMGWADWRNRRW